MKLAHLSSLALMLSVACAACPPTPYAPPPDASDGAPPPPPPPLIDASSPVDADVPDLLDAKRSECDAACVNLKALGCKEGADPACNVVCASAQGKLTDLHPACLRAAKTKAQARACKSVDCP